jgi:ribose/xylose/arabinose/galactoside ABC-type transport system permease subunit
MHDRSAVQDLDPSIAGELDESWKDRIGAALRGKGRNAGLITLMAVLFAWTGAHNSNFVTIENLRVLGMAMAPYAILGVGMTFLLISGNVDLSVGEIYALAAVLSAEFSIHMPVWLAIVLAILVGGGIGLCNGILVWLVKMSPIIITLGSWFTLAGINLLITHGYAVTGEPGNYTAWGNATPLGIPMLIFVFLVCALIGSVFLSTTKQGRHIFAVGGSREASRAAGLDVRLIVIGCFVFTGLLSGLAGTLVGSEYGAPDPTYSANVVLTVITGVILGGVSFAGGEGGVIGAMLGVAMLALIDGSIVALGIDPYYAGVVKGVILILAVSADQFAQVSRDRRQKAMAIREQARLEEQRQLERERMVASRSG